MKKMIVSLRGRLVIGLALVLVLALAACAAPAGSGAQQPSPATPTEPAAAPQETAPAQAADPQHLLIPRWFLADLTVDGQAIEVAPDQQSVTIQFQEDGKVNGSGGCNNFSATYSATPDGKMAFGPIVSTKMACEPAMILESVYFQGLSRVERFSTEDLLVLSSADGSVRLSFRMPPK